MKIKSTFKLDEDYYKLFLSEWIRSISNGRKFEPLLCVISVALGGVALSIPKIKIVGFFFIFVGAFEFYNYLKFKRDWIKKRTETLEFNSTVSYEFENGTARQVNPKLKNDKRRLATIHPSSKGYFFRLEEDNGNKESIYIPHESLSPPVSKDEFIKSFGNSVL